MVLPDLSPRPGDLDPVETMPRDQLAALQLERLRTTLARAYERVPHYRNAFDAAGVHPDDVRTLVHALESTNARAADSPPGKETK